MRVKTILDREGGMLGELRGKAVIVHGADVEVTWMRVSADGDLGLEGENAAGAQQYLGRAHPGERGRKTVGEHRAVRKYDSVVATGLEPIDTGSRVQKHQGFGIIRGLAAAPVCPAAAALARRGREAE